MPHKKDEAVLLQAQPSFQRFILPTLFAGIALTLLAMLFQTAVVRLLFDDSLAPGSSLHIRFGPEATAK